MSKDVSDSNGRLTRNDILTRTPHEDAKIIKLYNAGKGKSIADIANVFGVSRQVMLSRLKILKAWVKKKKPVNKDRIIDLCVNQNKTLSEISRETGSSKVSIYHILKDAGVKCKRSSGPGKSFVVPRETLYDLFIIQDMTASQIAQKYKCSKSVVRARLREAGISKILKGPNRVKVAPKATLYDLYITQDMSANQIAKQYNCSSYVIRARLKEAGIKKIRKPTNPA
ncbi:TPA: ImmA/IrrE family metallo-endopeptidase [Pseudomonas putida]